MKKATDRCLPLFEKAFATLLAHFFDVFIRGGVKGSFTGSVSEGDLTAVSDFFGWVHLLFTQRALHTVRAQDVAQVGFGIGVELVFATVTADGNSLAVVAGNGRAGRVAGDRTNFVQRLSRRGQSSKCSEGEQGEDVFHKGVFRVSFDVIKDKGFRSFSPTKKPGLFSLCHFLKS